MKADFTRNTDNAFKHFARVLMQQGRVQLDADWNEQAAILLRYLRTLAADLIGPQGGPAEHLGFGITAVTTPAVPNDFGIGLGRYYVDGILCEADSQPVGFVVQTDPNKIVVDQRTLDGAPFQTNQLVEVFDDVQLPNVSAAFPPTLVQITNVDQAKLTLTLQTPAGFSFKTPVAPKLRRVYTYMTQPEYPVPDSEKLSANGSFLIYLDVWERLITYVEDDAIREVALLGPDTAARSKVVWQVKAIPGRPSDNGPGNTSTCDNFTPADSAFLAKILGANRGRLRARAKQTAASTDPCIIPPDANYRGPENQLYRVEIHRPGAAWDGTANGKSSAATFKWSRENGAVVFPILSVASGEGVTTITLETLGRDDRFGLSEGEWVEVQDDTYVLQNRAEKMLQIQAIDRTATTVTLTGAPGSNVGQDSALHPMLRRWDYQQGDPADGGLQLGSDNAALIVESATAWLELEDGVQIQFRPPDAGQPATLYHTGDYWLIPARTATADVEWPTEPGKDSQGNAITLPLAKPPDGVQHHYAPLAVVTLTSGAVALDGDCRKHFDTIK
jgi:hypothetical protein